MYRIMAVILIALLCSAPVLAQNSTTTTFVLIRHAEKVITPPSNDPELSAEGLKRAEKLAAMLQATPFAAVYSTPFKRTINTAKPLAQAQGLTIQHYDTKANAAFLDSLLQKHAGATVLVVGHSNTIPQLLNALIGREQYQSFSDTDYDNIFLVSLTKRGNASVSRLLLKM